MISVINTEPEVTSNPFPGMSLAEACNAAEISVMDIMNEFHMGILLTEHSYLYENGVEMEYVDEAGNLNERAANLKAKAIEAITAAGRTIAELFDKALEWVVNAAESAKIALQKAGIRSADVNHIINNFDSVFSDDNIVAKVKYTVDPSFTQSGAFIGFMRTAKQVGEERQDPYEKYVTAGENTIKINSGVFKAAWDAINSSALKNSITSAKKSANTGIKDQITRIKKMGHEDMNEEISGLKDAMRANTKAATSLIKVYHAYMNQQIAIVRAVMNSPTGRDTIRNGRKDAVKAAPGKAKDAVKDAHGKAKEAVNVASRTAVSAVATAPSRARNAIEDAKDENEFSKVRNGVKKFNKNVEKQTIKDAKKQAKEIAKAEKTPKEKKHFGNPLKKK